MAIIAEDYVSFETAKLLKEKGFNEKLQYYYDSDKILIRCNRGEYFDNKSNAIFIAPTLQMAMKWLREVHNWHIVIERGPDSYYPHIEAAENKIEWSHEVIIGRIFYSSQDIVGKGKFATCELACEAAIKYCLENLI